MLTTAFLYWKLRQSQGGNGASLSAALRLGIRSKKKPFDHKSDPSEFSVETVSEPKLNINVDLENQVGNDPFPDINSFNIDSSELDELALIKNRGVAPGSVDLRLDLLRKLVKLDDQEGFKKAVDELTFIN